MKEIASNLKRILKQKGITQKELAEMIGISTSAISDYMTAKTLMSPGTIQIVADALNIRKGEIDPTFRGTINSLPDFIPINQSEVVELPIVGRVSCGNGTLAYEEIEGYEPTPKEWLNGGEYFYLRAKGDSMTGARIHEGDLLLIRKQEMVENGEIAAVLIDEELLLKRVYHNGEQLILQSENSAYAPILCPPAGAKIIGKLKMNVIKY